MPPVPALVAIVTATAIAIFAGDVPGALLRIPGTPASAAYTDETFAMARNGQAELVLGTRPCRGHRRCRCFQQCLAGGWVPALAFGIPGDSITAIVVGVLYVKGMNPGPTVFLDQSELVYAVFLTFFLANVLLLPLGLIAIKSAKQILRRAASDSDADHPAALAACAPFGGRRVKATPSRPDRGCRQ